MLRSLEEAQHEASRLQCLNHPCIVAFLGASLYPPSVILEFAPFGSLRSYIKKVFKEEKESLLANASGQQVTPMFPNGVFGRQLTVQIAYQVRAEMSTKIENNPVF